MKYTASKNRANRIHAKLRSRSDRPRLLVKRSNNHLHAQVIALDGKVLASASTLSLKEFKGTKTAAANEIGTKLVDQINKSKVGPLVFDRGQYRFHGRVKALVETLREKGVKI